MFGQNMIDTSPFFLYNESADKIELGITKGLDGTGKFPKKGVTRVDVPYHLQVLDCSPPSYPT